MNLRLSLKKKWFEMTKSGIKTEDYRELNFYWFNRLVFKKEKVIKYLQLDVCDKDYFEIQLQHICKTELYRKMIGLKQFQTNTMTLGYPKSSDTERIIKFEHAGIEIRTGNPEWGAEPNKLYFVIKHGKRL
jgi:hypothetical protein